ncbi:D-2-hydroxyacid dehydrogenase [Deinococcus maricopensis]|nr:D-2-hydroxyacid dehydrogenase [Deinococcus maricopensis]
MNVLIPDLPAFRSLAVPGVTFTPYGPEGASAAVADGVVLWGVRREHLSALLRTPGLQWALTLTAGVNHVTPHLPEHVTLYNASALHENAVAQHATATILAAARGLHRARDAQREGVWRPERNLWTLDDRSVVIWGMGHIGRRLARHLEVLGARVTGLTSGSAVGEVDEALAGADVLVLLLPSTPDTRGLVGESVLARLSAGAWVANYGRGDLIVTDALVAALQGGHLGGAILDVTDPEPLPPGHALWALENVILTPHTAGTTADVAERGAAYAQRVVAALAAGEDVPGRVDLSRGY